MTVIADAQTVEKILSRVENAYKMYGILTGDAVRTALIGGISMSLKEAEAEREREGEPIYNRADLARAWERGYDAYPQAGFNPYVEVEPEPPMIATKNPELWR